MLLITTIDDIPAASSVCALTIGSFDGVHLGHQSLIRSLRGKLPEEGTLAAFTFSNHPSQLFFPQTPTPLICSSLQKAKHLFESGVDLLIMVPFDKKFASLTFDTFLAILKRKLNFKWLILGEGATFGKGKQGDSIHVKGLENELCFEVEYIPKTALEQQNISSGRIRLLIQQGLLKEASACLGRPYHLMGHTQLKKKHLFCPFPGICLPPEKVYPVQITYTEGSPLFTSLHVSHHDSGCYLMDVNPDRLLNQEITITFKI